ncbi:MAG: hypothetical protein ACI88H_002769, partial [Cocleimonas sp.]
PLPIIVCIGFFESISIGLKAVKVVHGMFLNIKESSV